MSICIFIRTWLIDFTRFFSCIQINDKTLIRTIWHQVNRCLWLCYENVCLTIHYQIKILYLCIIYFIKLTRRIIYIRRNIYNLINIPNGRLILIYFEGYWTSRCRERNFANTLMQTICIISAALSFFSSNDGFFLFYPLCSIFVYYDTWHNDAVSCVMMTFGLW